MKATANITPGIAYPVIENVEIYQVINWNHLSDK